MDLADLIAHPDEAGGLDNLATVIAAIGDIDVAELARLAMMRSRVLSPGGWDGCSTSSATASSFSRCARWLLPQTPTQRDSCVRSPRGPLDQSWNLQINTSVEPHL